MKPFDWIEAENPEFEEHTVTVDDYSGTVYYDEHSDPGDPGWCYKVYGPEGSIDEDICDSLEEGKQVVERTIASRLKLKDPQASAASLFDGGWRSADRDELQEEYSLTDEETAVLVGELARMEASEKLIGMQVRLPESLHKALKKKLIDDDQTIQGLFTQAVKEYLEN